MGLSLNGPKSKFNPHLLGIVQNEIPQQMLMKAQFTCLYFVNDFLYKAAF